MDVSDKVKSKAVGTMKSLIEKGTPVENVISAVSNLTGVDQETLKAWISSENFQNFLEEKKSDNSPKNALAPPDRNDRLFFYRDQRINAGMTAEDMKLGEIQEEYLSHHYEV